MKLQDLLDEWEKDSLIDSEEIAEASMASARLHSKYLELYMHSKINLKKAQSNYESRYGKKKRYYLGKLTKEEIDAMEWKVKEYDPYKGERKPLKGDLDSIIRVDEDVKGWVIELEHFKCVTEASKEILDNIKWRHQTIKNIILHKQFIAGM